MKSKKNITAPMDNLFERPETYGDTSRTPTPEITTPREISLYDFKDGNIIPKQFSGAGVHQTKSKPESTAEILQFEITDFAEEPEAPDAADTELVASTKAAPSLDNLPPEFLSAEAFIPVREDKTPRRISAWQKPENQMSLTDARKKSKYVAVVIPRDVVFIDLDHVLDDNGQPVNEAAWQIISRLIELGAYIELSISGHGLHAFLIVNFTRFKDVTLSGADGNGIIWLTESHDNESPHVEIYFNTGGKCCLVTGNLYYCEPKTHIPQGDDADNHFQDLLTECKTRPTARADAMTYCRQHKITPDQAREMLNYIPCPDLDRNTWMFIGMALRYEFGDAGEAIFDEWNQTDPDRYHEHENRTQWKSFALPDSFNGKPVTLGTVIFYAQKYGYKLPCRSLTQMSQDELQRALAAARQELETFNTQKDAAIELLKNDLLEPATALDADLLEAAAFAKLFSPRDYERYHVDISGFGKKIRGFEMKQWKQAVTEQAKIINKRYRSLNARIMKLEAELKNREATKKFTLPDNRPTDYFFDENGIYKLEEGKRRLISPQISWVDSRVRIKDGNIFLYGYRIVFIDEEGKRHFITCTADVLATRSKIATLAPEGLRVNDCNSKEFITYFDAWLDLKLPKILQLPHCGWYTLGGKSIFVDPRRTIEYTNNDGDTVKVEISPQNQFVQYLTQKGSLDGWLKAYELIHDNPVAIILLAAACAAALLKRLGLRNFTVHVWAPTRAGKTTLLEFAMSAVGAAEMIHSFHATGNGILGAMIERNDYSFAVDEKEVADAKLNLNALAYVVGIGKGKTRATKNGSVTPPPSFRTIMLSTGETSFLEDTAKGGAETRTLTIHAPAQIIPTETCSKLRRLTKENFGWLFPLVIEEFEKRSDEELQQLFDNSVEVFKETQKEADDQYISYMSLLAVTYSIILDVLNPAENEFDGLENLSAAQTIIGEVFSMIPTAAQIDETNRRLEALSSFVAGHLRYFEREAAPIEWTEKYRDADDNWVEEEHVKTANVESSTYECYGRIFKDGSVAFLPTAFTKIIEIELGFGKGTAKGFLEQLRDRQKLDCVPKRFTKLMRFSDKLNWMHVFKPNVLAPPPDDNLSIRRPV